MMPTKLNPTVLCFLWLLPLSLFAKEIYVSPTGDDDNEGTQSSPYASLNQASAVADPGDTIYMLAGVYRYSDGQSLNANGTKNAPIRLYNKGGTVYLDGTENENNNVISIRGSYWDIRRIRVHSSAYNGINIKGAAHHIKLANVHAYNNQYSGILVEEKDGARPHHITIVNSKIYDNVLHNADQTIDGGWAAAVSFLEADNSVVKKCQIYRNFGEGILFAGSTGNDARDNVLWDNFSVNIYIDSSKDCWIERNDTASYDPRYFKTGFKAQGVQIANEPQWYSVEPYFPARNIRVLDNNIHDAGYGFWFWKATNRWNDHLQSTGLNNNQFQNNGSDVVIDADNGTNWGNDLPY